MKKLTFLLILSFSFLTNSYAFEIDSTHSAYTTKADTGKAIKKHERRSYLSVNATFFLKQFLSFSSQSVNISGSPYIFDYRYIGKHNSGFRISAGASYNQQKTTIPGSINQTGIDETDNDHVLNVSYRIGYLFQKPIAKRWTIMAGVDFIGTVTDSAQKVTSGTDVSTNDAKGWTIGIGPTVGIQFDINKRMGLYTEASIYYTHGGMTETNNFNSFPQDNGNVTISSNGFNFIVPVSIFYYIRF